MVIFARRYEILGQLGQGGFGQVFRAMDHNQAQEVALKLYGQGAPPVLAFREAQALTALQSPNILSVLNAAVHQDIPYIATRVAADGSAEDRTPPGLGVPPTTAVLWTRHLLNGLQVCHRARLVHRDIKPANLFLQSSELALLGDLGLVERLNAFGVVPVAGTPPYLPPEAFTSGIMNERSDIYDVGLTLWFLLTGVHAFEPASVGQIPLGVPTRLHNLAPHVPAALTRVVERAISVDPGARYESVEAMDDAMGRLAATSVVWQEVPPAGCTRLWRSLCGRYEVRVVQRVNSPNRFDVHAVHAGSGNRISARCVDGLSAAGLPVALRRTLRAFH